MGPVTIAAETAVKAVFCSHWNEYQIKGKLEVECIVVYTLYGILKRFVFGNTANTDLPKLHF